MNALSASSRPQGIEDAGFSIERRDEGGTIRLILHGELDLGGEGILRDELLQAERGSAELVVVLDQLDYLDSAGIGQLVESAHRARRAGRRFSVTPGAGNVRRVLWISGVLSALCVGDPTGPPSA